VAQIKKITAERRDTRIQSNENRVVRIKTENGRGSALRILIIAAIIAVQLGLLIYFYVELAMAFRSYLVFSFVMSLLTCIYVLSTNKNSLSKAVWIIFLLLGFVFSYTVYFLSDERIFFNRPKKKYSRIFKETEGLLGKYREGREPSSSECAARYLYSVGGYPNFTGTECKYYSSGSLFFDDVLAEISRAEKFIFLEFFIVSDGVLMRRFTDIIKRKCEEGVDVRLIYDDMGSNKTLSRKTISQLASAGVRIMPFNRLIPIFSVAMNYRDHRKIVVVDGKRAFSGGVNFADEYINEKRMFGYWKDAGLGLAGDAVRSFTLMFLRQWRYLSSKKEDLAPYLAPQPSRPSEHYVIPFADGLDHKAPIGKGIYELLISGAARRILIMTPYFIPGDTITDLLIAKAHAGVDVKLILPGIPDKAFVYAVSRNNAEKLIDHGVELYCMKQSFVHTKLVIADDSLVVGSINMDLRSFYQQFECAVFTNDPRILNDATLDYEDTLRESERILPEAKKRNNLFRRIFTGVMQIFAPFM